MKKLRTTLVAAITGCALVSTAGVTAAATAGPSPARAAFDQPLRTAGEPSSAARSTFLASLPTLRQGAAGGEVLALQIGLRYSGADQLQGTGYFGPLTERAVRVYQQQQGLTVDGVVGPRTWDSLVIDPSGGAPYSLENPQISPGQVWPLGEDGTSRYGYLELGLDTLHQRVAWAPEPRDTSSTRYDGTQVEVVREIQRRAGLNPSGILGARTTRVLLVISAVVYGFGN